MTLVRSTIQWALSLSAFCLMSTAAQASGPLWSVVPIDSPHVTVSAIGTATVEYKVTNNTKKELQVVLSSNTPKGISQGGTCKLDKRGTAHSSCALTLKIKGSELPSNHVSGGPILCQTAPDGMPYVYKCSQPSSGHALDITRTTVPEFTILSVSPSTLGLAVKDSSLNVALTGKTRQITITNTGEIPATGLTITYPTWPIGTSSTSNCTGTLAAGAACTIAITPGSNATSNCNIGTAPAASATAIVVNATNAITPVTAKAAILSYGCLYQGGYLFSVDDTTSPSVGIGGTVVSTSDQAPAKPNGIVWSSNGTASAYSSDTIPGIDDSSTTSAGSPTYAGFTNFFTATYTNTPVQPAASAFNECNSITDGHCNTNNILAFYNTWHTHYSPSCDPSQGGNGRCTASAPAVTTPSYYAAGLCSQYSVNSFGTSPCTSGTCYQQWYLPAICEMGPTTAGSLSDVCPAGIQNILNDFPGLIGDINAANPMTSCPVGTNCLAGEYWSSNEWSILPALSWFEYFGSNGASLQSIEAKFTLLGVRCARALTP